MGKVIKPDVPEFNFADADQFRRIATYLMQLHRNAVEAVKRGEAPHVYTVDVVRKRDWASGAQRGYLWGVVYPHAAQGLRDSFGEEGANSYRAHEFFKNELLKQYIVNRTDQSVTSPTGAIIGAGEVVGTWTPSLGELDTHDMTVYIDGIIDYAAKTFGIAIPPPLKVWDDPQLERPPVAPQIDYSPPRADGARQLPPGVVSGPTREDGVRAGMDPDDLDRAAERLSGTPEDL